MVFGEAIRRSTRNQPQPESKRARESDAEIGTGIRERSPKSLKKAKVAAEPSAKKAKFVPEPDLANHHDEPDNVSDLGKGARNHLPRGS